MKKAIRLQNPADFGRVRQQGKSFAHPIMVLALGENQLPLSRIGIVAGKRVGNAVERNRAKRLLRIAADGVSEQLPSGWDILLIARQGLPEAHLTDVHSALTGLLRRAFPSFGQAGRGE